MESNDNTPAPDPALVAAMKTRTVKRKNREYGNTKPGPGRPKGISKPEGSGRKAGTPNIWTPEFREWLSEKAQPFELLADICSGLSIEDAGVKRKPTLPERMRAAETLGRKLLPDLAATSISTPQLEAGNLHGLAVPSFELARRLAFVLANGIEQMDPDTNNSDTKSVRQPETINHAPPQPCRLPPEQDDLHNVGSCTIELAEHLADGRERWAIRDQKGRLVASCFGRDNAETKAQQFSENANG